MARTIKQAEEKGAKRFPALPPSPGRRGFATTWWGEEWIAALEETSMDPGRLSRGRTYARRGAVGEITVTPGRVSANVHGSQPRPYNSAVHIRVLSNGEWDRLLDTVAGKALHIAALLDRDMPEDLAEDAADAGVALLPDVDDLEPACTCPDWGYPCKHAAAVCYQIARILDEDPFVLLLMRGRGENEIMQELHRRNAAQAATEQAESEPDAAEQSAANGVPAREAFAAWTPGIERPPLPEPAAHAGQPAMLDTGEPCAGIDPAALEMLAADASTRAKTLLDLYHAAAAQPGDGEPADFMPTLDAHRDAIRLLSGDRRDVGVFARVADALDIEPMHLVRAMLAWRHSGAAGLEALEHPWTPPTAAIARARTLLEAAWQDTDPPAPKQWRNRWTFADLGVQLRYGRDERWHPYRRRDDGAWWPDGPSAHDPADLLASTS